MKTIKEEITRLFKAGLGKFIIFFVLLLLVVVMGILKPATISVYYFGIKFDNALPLIFLSAGQTLVLICGGMDLSVGGVMSLTTCVLATLGLPVSVLVLLVLFIGIGTGAVNGFIINRFKAQPFIVTLGTWTMLNGCSYLLLVMDGGVIPNTIKAIFTFSIGDIPISFFIIIVLLIVWHFIKNSQFGYAMFALGSNEKAAYLSGIRIKPTLMYVYMLSGLFAALGGLVYAGQTGTGSPIVGNGNIMLSVAGTVIGGTSLSGGRGGLPGTIVGVFILKLISDVLVFSKVTSYWVAFFQGCLLIGCVAISTVIASIREKRSSASD